VSYEKSVPHDLATQKAYPGNLSRHPSSLQVHTFLDRLPVYVKPPYFDLMLPFFGCCKDQAWPDHEAELAALAGTGGLHADP